MQLKNILLILLLVIAVQSCYEDKGDYDYITPNDIKITLAPRSSNGYIGELYVYNPALEFSIPADSLNFSYWWEYIGDEKGEGEFDTLCMGREFRYVPNKLGATKIRFCALDNSTSIITSREMTLNITSTFNRGWVILGERNGESVLSMLRPGYTTAGKRMYDVFPSLYDMLNPRDLLGSQPQQLRQVLNETAGILLVIQRSGSVYLNGTSFGKEIRQDMEFFGDRTPAGYKLKDFRFGATIDMALAEDNKLYIRNYMTYNGRNARNFPFFTIRFDDTPMKYHAQSFDVAELCSFHTYNAAPTAALTKDRNSFVWLSTQEGLQGLLVGSRMQGPHPIMETPAPEGCVDFNNFGEWELLYAAHTKSSFGGRFDIVTLFKNKNNGRVIVQRQLPWGGNLYQEEPYKMCISTLQNFAGADVISDETKYYMLPSRNFIFFAEKNKIYYCEPAGSVRYEFCTFDPSDKVVDMTSNLKDKELGVVFSSGRFMIFDITYEELNNCKVLYDSWVAQWWECPECKGRIKDEVTPDAEMTCPDCKKKIVPVFRQIERPDFGTPVDLEYKYSKYMEWEQPDQYND